MESLTAASRPYLPVHFDFESKGLVDVTWDDQLADGESREIRLTGSATLAYRVKEFPLMEALGPDEDDALRLPLRVRFRIARHSNAEALDNFNRNRDLYKELTRHGYEFFEKWIAFWHVPDEGNWGIGIDHSPEPLVRWWARAVRPGMEACEEGWRKKIEKRGRERRASKDEGRISYTTADPVKSREERNSSERSSSISPVHELKSIYMPEKPSLDGTSSSDSSATLLDRGEAARLVDDDDEERELHTKGYLQAVQVLIQIADSVLGLHLRRLCIVVIRPEHFVVCNVPSPSTSSMGSPSQPFSVRLVKIATAVTLKGWDGGRLIESGPRSPIGVKSTADSPDGFFDINNGRQSPTRHGDVGVDTLDSVYDEGPIRYHARYIAPEALASKAAFGVFMDVYSFGVLAHQLISGKTRYDGMDPSMDLLSVLNMYRSMPLRRMDKERSSVPVELGEIVEKCLRLDFDERYLNFQSLIHDLHSVRDLMLRKGSQDFRVGHVDDMSRFALTRATTALYERDAQLAAFDRVYEEVKATGNVKVVCAWGVSGSGKSHLVEQWARGIDGGKKESECFIASAKMDQHLVKPLSGLVQIFESLLSAIFSDPKQDHAEWRLKILDVLQAQASVFLSLISPSWREVLLGTEEEMTPDDSSDTVNDSPDRETDWARNVSSFRTWAWSLLRLFSSPQRPLIIILDDVQWQEPAETDLWVGLLEHESRHLVNAMVCLTSRTDTEPQLAFSNTLKLAIKPLGQASVQKLVANALHVDGPLNAALTFVALFLHSTTSGNPFYCCNLLGALFRDGVLRFDYLACEWNVETSSLPLYGSAGIETFTTGVLSSLPADVKTVIKVLACLPSRGVPVSLLTSLTEMTTTKVQSSLRIAAQVGCVAMANDGTVTFTHDRMQAAALNLIHPSETLELHLVVGRKLQTLGGEYIFTATDALLTARKLGDKSVDLEELCNLIISAAKRAARSAAFELAYRYLGIADAMMCEKYGKGELFSKAPQQSMWYQLLPLWAEVCGSLGKTEEGIEKVEEGLLHTEDVHQKLEIYILLMRLHVLEHNVSEILTTLQRGLQVAGFGQSDADFKERRASLPSDLPSFEAALTAAAATVNSPEEEAISASIITLVAHAGPTIYTSLPDHGVGYFDIALMVGLSSSSLIQFAPWGYVLSVSALSCIELGFIEVARAFANYAKSIRFAGTLWQGAIDVATASSDFLSVRSVKDVSYSASWERSVQDDNTEIASYVLSLDLMSQLIAGRDVAIIVTRAARELKLLTGIAPILRICITAMQRAGSLLADLSLGKQPPALGPFKAAQIFPGSSFPYSTDFGFSIEDWELLELAPFFALFAWMARSWVEISYGMDAAHSVAQVNRLSCAGAGTVFIYEALFLVSFHAVIRGGPATPDELESLRETREKFKAIPDLVDFQLRLGILDAVETLNTSTTDGIMKRHEAFKALEKSIDLAEENSSFLLAGFMAMFTAKFLRKATSSRRMTSGYVQSAEDSWQRASAAGLLRYAQQEFPELLQSQIAARRARPEEDGPKAKVLTPSSESASVSDDHGQPSKAASLEAKLSLDSILKTCLVLASERDRHRLLQSLLDIVLQVQRADYACFAMADPKSQEMALALVAAGSYGSIMTYDDLKLSNAATKCPCSILLHTANTKRTRRLSDPGSILLFKRDPFFGGLPPKSAACYPLRVQGKFVGVFFVSSKSTIAAASEHQVTVLATFAAIALENQYARSTLESIITSRTLQLTQALSHRSSFLTSVSHELRTPLFSIIGLLTVLENSSDLSAPHLETLSTIRASSQQLHRLIDNVLDLAKLEAGSIAPERIPFSLRDVTESTLETLAYVANSKGLELVLTTDVSKDPPPLLGDPHRLRQALLNLIANAIKFTNAGRVEVAYKVEQEESRFRVEVFVKDTGVGVAPDQMSRLFHAFSQVDNSVPGTGLGLAITRELSHLLDGETWCESELGKGSTFHIMIMCDLDPTKVAKPLNISNAPTRKAAVICRKDATADVLCRNLVCYNVDCGTVADTLDALPADGLDLVLLDLKFLGIDAEHLHRMQEQHPNTMMYYLVPVAAVGETITTYDVPHTSVVTTPVKASRLREISQTSFDRPKPTRENSGIKKSSSAIDRYFAESHPLKLLYVDDNKVNVVVGVRILSRYGYKSIDTAFDGQQAMDALVNKSYDLIFMDLQMPVMDGMAFIRSFNETKHAATTPVVALTANCDDATRERCLSSGFSYFLSKPLSIPNLTAVLERVYGAKHDA